MKRSGAHMNEFFLRITLGKMDFFSKESVGRRVKSFISLLTNSARISFCVCEKERPSNGFAIRSSASGGVIGAQAFFTEEDLCHRTNSSR